MALERSVIERALAQLWVEILDVPEVTPDDNFVALGGDSIVSRRALRQSDPKDTRPSRRGVGAPSE